MKPLSLVALSLLIISLGGSGCAAIQAQHRNRQLLRTNYAEEEAKRRQKTAAEKEKLLNAYFAKARVELPSVPLNSDGFRTTRDMALKAEKDLASVRYNKQNRQYTWPQLEGFVQQWRTVRDQQLEALRPLLTDESGKTSPEASGALYFIHAGMFTETGHPVYLAARATQRRIYERKMAEAKRLQDEQAAKAAKIFFDLLTAAARARQQRAEDFKARGLCPDCEGDGKINVTHENKCYTCAGSGFTYVQGGICPVCGGMGTIGVGTTDIRECRPCSGSGRYSVPGPK